MSNDQAEHERRKAEHAAIAKELTELSKTTDWTKVAGVQKSWAEHDRLVDREKALNIPTYDCGTCKARYSSLDFVNIEDARKGECVSCMFGRATK